jgi:hypothetical protein
MNVAFFNNNHTLIDNVLTKINNYPMYLACRKKEAPVKRATRRDKNISRSITRP